MNVYLETTITLNVLYCVKNKIYKNNKIHKNKIYIYINNVIWLF